MKKRYDSLGQFAYKLVNYHITIRILEFPWWLWLSPYHVTLWSSCIQSYSIYICSTWPCFLILARWCRGDLHRCLCEGTQWTHLWCNIDQGILNCLLILDSIDIHPFHLFQRDSDPKEIFLNLYGIHCDPNAFFQWEKIAGASTILLSIWSIYSLLLTILFFFFPEDWQPLNLKFIPFQLTHTQ